LEVEDLTSILNLSKSILKMIKDNFTFVVVVSK